ncbi:MAG: EAL domain-containing protein [Acholeplasmatales bacterium]|nr:EAL domain-containing protein [Acholeplasmatales bacterium]
MEKGTLLSNLLYLYDALTFSANIKDKKISFLYKGSKLLAKEQSYEEFAKLFLKTLKIVPSGVEKLVRFLNNLNPSTTPFDLPVEYLSISGDPVRVNYKGFKYSEYDVLFTVSLVNESHSDELDPLTKSYSKAFMIEKVKESINNNKPFSMMIIDIDNFKTFNDTYGHMFGDIVLVETVAAVNSVLKNNGYISRIGGDEFLVLYYMDNDYDTVHSLCKLVRDSISELSKNNVKQAEITATMGCSSYPKDGDDYETLFKKADKALYRGKKKGRNCFIIYTEERCGLISEEDGLEKTMDRMFANSTNYNIIAGVLEILNRDFSLKKNITEALSLIGSYFLLDRIVFSSQNPDTLENTNEIVWYQPRSVKYPVKEPTYYEKSLWNKTLDKTGMLRIVQVQSNKNLPVYPLLNDDKSSAVLAFSLTAENKIYGLVRYEMCSINKFWQQQDIASLMLISKMFSIKLNKEYHDNKHIKELYFDQLTDIYNYTKWRREVSEYLDINPKLDYSVLDFNIIGFRNLNDILGTESCDEILVLIANKLKTINGIIYARETDDKFLIFFPHQNKDIIEETLDSISTYVKENNRTKKTISLNAGVYLANSSTDDVSISIDKANITRKNKLTNEKIAYYCSQIDEIEKEKLTLELHMHDAKENGEFLLYLQPKFDTKKNKIVGAEALTRWNYNFEKILYPNTFIPLFERNGFITELDYQVFENVCKFQRMILDEHRKPVIISVNVSRYQFDFDKYIETIESIRMKYNISPSLIEIEITEGMYKDNIAPISKFIDNLHDHGYNVSMDDFGSGYSNLTSLANLDFDIIKLDKSFCNNIENKKETAVLSFVMQLAKKLNIKVLCEGVETQEYSDYLKSIGCTLIQGYLYDKPLPSIEFKNKYFPKKTKNLG